MQAGADGRDALELPAQRAGEDYFGLPGLSNSGMTDLAVSPFRYWYLHVNPDRPPDESTPTQVFGSALHCAVLEPEEVFEAQYARKCEPEDYPGCLVTIEDIRTWIRDKEQVPRGTKKTDVIAQALSIDPHVEIFDAVQRRHAIANQGKILLTGEDWRRLTCCVAALRDEPRLVQVLKEGAAEVQLFANDPETGVPLKGKLDFVAPKQTLDLKTFTVKRGASVDRAVSDAIYFEGYYRQAYFYTLLRCLQRGGSMKDQPDFVMAFVESDPPHEVRLRVLRSKTGGSPNLYWETARRTVHDLIHVYAHYAEHFGDEPWRTAREIDPLHDEDVRQLAWLA